MTIITDTHEIKQARDTRTDAQKQRDTLKLQMQLAFWGLGTAIIAGMFYIAGGTAQ